jgi:nucleoside-diphosphate-sugar epimerase
MILVTGGTGLIGSHLLYFLSLKHDSIRAIYRTKKKIESVKHVFSYYSSDVEEQFSKIEWIQATLNDIPRLTEAFANITNVYHCAALVSFDPNVYIKLRRINIQGTANIVNLCVTNRITKLCYVSSVAAVGKSESNGEVDEDTPWDPEENHSVYAITKYGAEMEVWRGTQEGVDAIIVNPGIVIGPGFWRSSSGSFFSLINRGLKYYTQGVTGYVDVQDVVKCMILAMESSIINERYILISENLSFKSFTLKMAEQLGVPPPKKEAKNWLLQVGWRLDWLRCKIKRKRRKLTKNTAKSITRKIYFRNEKVRDHLNFEFISIDESIKQTSSLFLKDRSP